MSPGRCLKSPTANSSLLHTGHNHEDHAEPEYNSLTMKIILSRKGFDSSAGGGPSPILPDGRMLSLPIPDRQSPIRYQDIRWQDDDLGSLVSDLTHGLISPSHGAHLDPDIADGRLSRPSQWRPVFGQTGAAQGHLRKHGIQTGDVFLFFGLFQDVVQSSGKSEWDNRSPRRHVIWGWLQVEEILKVDAIAPSKYLWARYHPHFHRQPDPSNTLYTAHKVLTLPGVVSRKRRGAGVFSRFSTRLALTAPNAVMPTQWELPLWFYPRGGRCPLTYHSNLARWQRNENSARLNAVARGQEFILDTADFPEAVEWLVKLLGSG